ncbi:MAG: hypothetical protein GY820_29900 [Gammaproteobacteria bacterium]|nr:hypothetical protein [Gammaproteobacteria bacterium]
MDRSVQDCRRQPDFFGGNYFPIFPDCRRVAGTCRRQLFHMSQMEKKLPPAIYHFDPNGNLLKIPSF